MAHKKENLIKLLDFIKEIAEEEGNKWFKQELKSKFAIENIITAKQSVIDEIYEYCIRLIIKEQAIKFYADFKIIEIKNKLIDDHIRMEKFKREDNFEDFCLATYQQIESVISSLISDKRTIDYYSTNIKVPALLKFDFTTKSMIRGGNSTIGMLIFQTYDNNKIDKYIKTPINDWYFNHKFRAILYLYYFKTEIKNNSDLFEGIYEIGNYLYQGRNMNHRGSVQSEYQQKILNVIVPNQHKYYYKFMGFLEDFISTININL